MNKYYEYHKQTVCDRDKVFNSVIDNTFKEQPVKILEIGATRNLDINSKAGDGWSSLFWAQYIEEYGGELTIVDIDPTSIANCKEILSDFPFIKFIVDDGMKYLPGDYDFVYLDGGDDPNQMYEQYKLVDRRKTDILCDDFHGKGVRVRKDYPDFSLMPANHIHEMAFYPKVNYGDFEAKIGGLFVPYVRELPNRAYRNERAIELGLGKYFAEKFNNNIVELGAVCHQYSFFSEWPVVDPYDAFPASIRKDILDYDYTGKNVLSISTIEHCGMDLGYNQPKNEDLAVKGLEKITKESPNYLITFPLGVHRKLERFVKDNYANYFILKRKNPRGEPNEWELADFGDFQFNYGHFDFGLGYYGNALAICVVTNLTELL